jgi:hypothetical protein
LWTSGVFKKCKGNRKQKSICGSCATEILRSTEKGCREYESGDFGGEKHMTRMTNINERLYKARFKKALDLSTKSVLIVSVGAGSAIAHDEHINKNLQPHQTPHKVEPPTGGHRNLAEAATNPIANLMQMQLQGTYNFENHNASGYSNVATLQGVIPVNLSYEAVPLMINRTTVPFVTTPDLGEPANRKNGFGDTSFLNLFLPRLETEGVQVGLGFNSVLPTAGDNEFTGSGKLQIGPSAVFINMQRPSLQWGMFAYQLWDFADGPSGSDRDDVSALSLQPFVTQHFKGGWYIGTPDTPQTYNFKTDKWTWALGGQVGRVMKLGTQSIKPFGEVLYNPEDGNGPNAEWTAKFNLTFLLPK